MKQQIFFQQKGEFKAVPTRGGWLLTCDGSTLHTARGAERVFNALDTVAKVAGENGVKQVTVVTQKD